MLTHTHTQKRLYVYTYKHTIPDVLKDSQTACRQTAAVTTVTDRQPPREVLRGLERRVRVHTGLMLRQSPWPGRGYAKAKPLCESLAPPDQSALFLENFSLIFFYFKKKLFIFQRFAIPSEIQGKLKCVCVLQNREEAGVFQVPQ